VHSSKAELMGIRHCKGVVILHQASAEFYFEKFSSEENYFFFLKAENFEK
jgi:hypothetical protein